MTITNKGGYVFKTSTDKGFRGRAIFAGGSSNWSKNEIQRLNVGHMINVNVAGGHGTNSRAGYIKITHGNQCECATVRTMGITNANTECYIGFHAMSCKVYAKGNLMGNSRPHLET